MFTLGELKFLVITTPAMREAAHRLRYKVYVEDYKFEKPEDHPTGMEKDAFDEHSILFGAIDAHGRMLGTSRLILNGPGGLPALKLASGFYHDPNPASRKIVEVSRLAIDPSLQGTASKGLGDVDFYLNKMLGEGVRPFQGAAWETWQKRVLVLLGLIQLMFQTGQALAVTDYYMVGERSLGVLLKRHKILFHPLGPPIEHHGLREIYRGRDWEIGPPILAFQKKVIEALGLNELMPPAVRDARIAQVEEFGFGGFEFQVVRDKADLEALYELRDNLDKAIPPSPTGPAVYIQRRGKDRYDPHSIHLAAKRHDKVVGTLRIVLNSAEGLPCMSFAYPEYPDRHSTTKKIAELGRFALAQPYLSAFSDLLALTRMAPGEHHTSRASMRVRLDRWRAALILLGLIRLGYRLAKDLRVTKMYMMMEASLAETFARRGLFSHQVGEARPFLTGAGAPYLYGVPEVEPAMLDFRSVRAVIRDLVAMRPDRKDYNPAGEGAEEERLRIMGLDSGAGKDPGERQDFA